MAPLTHPFAVDEPGNVPLSKAPLVRTIAQIRFPNPTQFATDEEAVALRVAGKLAQRYPLLETGHEMMINLTPAGVTQEPSSVQLWRLSTADRSWQVTFTRSFLSIDTSAYERRSDFAERFAEAWAALTGEVVIPYVERIGVRYINRIDDPAHLGRLEEYLIPQVLGTTTAEDPAVARLVSVLSEARYRFADGAEFMGRWGLLAPEQTVDQTVPPVNRPSWVLDMDSFRAWPPSQSGELDIYDMTRSLALRAWQFLRWAARDEFLIAFGGDS